MEYPVFVLGVRRPHLNLFIFKGINITPQVLKIVGRNGPFGLPCLRKLMICEHIGQTANLAQTEYFVLIHAKALGDFVV